MIVQIIILGYIAYKLWDISETLSEIHEQLATNKGVK